MLHRLERAFSVSPKKLTMFTNTTIEGYINYRHKASRCVLWVAIGLLAGAFFILLYRFFKEKIQNTARFETQQSRLSMLENEVFSRRDRFPN